MIGPERIWIDGSVGGRYITASATPEDCMAPHGPYVCADLARPQVKPLVWVGNTAKTALGEYRIMRQVGTGDIAVTFPDGGGRFAADDAEARSLAFEHYSAAVVALLVPAQGVQP